MSRRTTLIASVGGFAFALFSSLGANAAPISATFNQILSSTPIIVSFDGVRNFSFVAAATPYGPGAGVSTIGSASVTTTVGSIADFYLGSSIDQTMELYTFANYPTSAVIPFSAADDFVGLSVNLIDGVHYGYAEVFGSSLIGIGFESSPNTSILTGATGTGAGIAISTPEPASVALVLTGLAMLSVRRRRVDREAS